MNRRLLLLSNDDGLEAKGLRQLIAYLRADYDLFVVAPDGQRSAMSSCVTSGKEVRATMVSASPALTEYLCSGTPADCVKLALSCLMPQQPDLVIGGINHGSNAGLNALYSGTVGAAREGSLHGIPSLAFSLCDHDPDADFSPLRPYILGMTARALREGLPNGTCINVNFPAVAEYAGVLRCRMGRNIWVNEFAETSPGSFCLGGDNINMEPDATDTDHWALEHGYVAVTPVGWDSTDYTLL